MTDSTRTTQPARVVFASSGQINFIVPAAATAGSARISVQEAGSGSETHGTIVELQTVAPALFSTGATAKAVAAALAQQAGSDGSLREVPVFRCSGPLLCVTQNLEPQRDRPVYLSLFATGVRNAGRVTATFAGETVPVLYAGPQGSFDGLDQINIRLDNAIRSRGEQEVIVTADGVSSNPVRIALR